MNYNWDAMDMIESGQARLEEIQKVAAAMGEKFPTREDLSRQFDRDFGIVIVLENGDKIRKFPLDSKSNTMLSIAAFKKNMNKIPDEARGIIANRITLACDRYGIEPVDGDISQLAVNSNSNSNYYHASDGIIDLFLDNEDYAPSGDDQGSSAEKTASSRTLWGINDNVNGEPLHKYAMKTSSQVINLINDFPKIASRMLSKYAFQLADNIVKRAAELKVHIPPDSDVMTYADGQFSPYFRAHMEARIKCAAPKHMDAAKEYMGLMNKTASLTPRQLAVELEGIDFAYNMHHRYGIDFGNPTHTILMAKQAESLDAGDAEIDTVKLQEAIKDHRALFEDYMDKDIVDKLEGDCVNTLKTLPVPLRQLIARILGSVS